MPKGTNADIIAAIWQVLPYEYKPLVVAAHNGCDPLSKRSFGIDTMFVAMRACCCGGRRA
jgi:hypothetical protein